MATEQPRSPDQRSTQDRARFLLLYDGSCRFCERSSRRLLGLARGGAIQRRDFRGKDALADLPVTREQCEGAMQLIDPGSGDVFSGAHGAARALATRPALSPVLWIYRLPVLRWLFDAVYRWIAKHRFLLGGKNLCQSGACDLSDRRDVGDRA